MLVVPGEISGYILGIYSTNHSLEILITEDGLTDTVGVFDEHEVAWLNGVVRRNVTALSLTPIPNGHNLQNEKTSGWRRIQKKDR